MQRLRILSFFTALIVAGLAWRAAFFTAGVRLLPVSADESLTVLQAKQIRAGRTPIFLLGQPYMFPCESYLHAPFVKHLPRTPWGARLPAFLLGLAGLGFSLEILRRLHPGAAAWPGALLILFPSAYLLLHQAAYAMPGYPTLLFCTSLSILAALYARRYPWCAIFSGLVAGAGYSAHALMLPAAMAAGLFSMWQIDQPPALPANSVPAAAGGPGANRRSEPQSAAAFAADKFSRVILRWAPPPTLWLFLLGAGLGLLPWLASMARYPAQHGAVLGRFAWLEALRRIWSPIIRHTLPTTMGVAPTAFPDNAEQHPWPMLEMIFLAVWCFLIVGGLFLLLKHFVTKYMGRQQAGAGSAVPPAADADLPAIAGMAAAPFYGMVCLNLAIFAASRRSDSGSFRYLLPLVWCFPFIIQHWFAAGPRRFRPVIGIMAAALALFNGATAMTLTRSWRAENFAAQAGLPDLQPTLDFLRRHDFRHGVASYGAAYRINFLTDEKIVCSQPNNERFPDWPAPYKAAVDAAAHVAYVLTDRIRFLKPAVFERHLRLMRIDSARAACGDFEIFYDFRELPRDPPDKELPAETVGVAASHNPADAGRLARAETAGGWTSKIPQTPGMWLELRWRGQLPVNRIELIQDYGNQCTPAAMDVSVWRSNQWQTVLMDAEPEWGKFVFRNGHPVYGIEPRILQWSPAQTDRLRLEIRRAHPHHPWVIGAIKLFHADLRPGE